MRSYLQNPDSSTGTATDKEKVYLGPRGARYYKNNGRVVPVRRIQEESRSVFESSFVPEELIEIFDGISQSFFEPGGRLPVEEFLCF